MATSNDRRRSTVVAPPPVRFAEGGEAVWRFALVLLVILAVLGIAMYWDTAAFIGYIWWTRETYAHGLIIFPLSGWMIWRHRAAILPLTPDPSWLGVFAVLLLSLGWLPGHLADVWVVQQIALILFAPALALAILGRRTAFSMAFPLLYLAFAIPAGEGLVPSLMDFTAWFSVEGLNLSGVPVYREGRFLAVPNGNFEVAEACSGVRYLIASLALGFLYAYLNYRSYWRRLAFIVLAAVVPIVANGLRAYAIIMIAHLSDMKYAVGVDHLIFGWVFFGVVMFFLFWIGSFWADPPDALAHRDLPDPVPPRQGIKARLVLFAAITLAAMGAGRMVAWVLDDQVQSPPADFVLQAPDGVGDWRGPLAAVENRWVPELVGTPLQSQARYQHGDEEVVLHVVYYPRQGADNEVVNDGNTLFRDNYWRRLETASHTITLADGRRMQVDETRVRGATGERLIWNWYLIDRRTTTSSLMMKALGAWQKFKLRDDAAMIAVATDFKGRPDVARARLTEFVTAMNTAISASVQVH
ncbi:MAG: exosortase A [Gammaproteobacteria bacterium]|nr:exosortase A [Gammaproteobacteria bacterium]MCP5137613.1 exosortase A [Gammaproteobacteria bacterium]